MSVQLQYGNIQAVYQFPAQEPSKAEGRELPSLDEAAHSLRDAASDARRAVCYLPELWHSMPRRDKEWWRAFAMGPTDSSNVSDEAKRLAYDLLIAYPDVVSEFINARLVLLGIVTELCSKDVWERAVRDKAFVKAAKRGTAAIRKGHVTAVSWDEL